MQHAIIHSLVRLVIVGYLVASTLAAHLYASTGAPCQSWQSLSSASATETYAMIVHNGSLYIGGSFVGFGGQTFNRIARWDGSAWHKLGTGMTGSPDPQIFALAVFNGELIAAGRFTMAGGVAANNIARWDGAQWHPLGTGIGGLIPAVHALAVHGGALYVGGQFTSAGGVPNTPSIARWTGAAWQAVGQPAATLGGPIWALTSYGNLLVAGGSFGLITPGGNTSFLAAWNGAQWGWLIGPPNNQVTAMTVYNNELIITGEFQSVAGVPAKGVARYNGQWLPLANGIDNFGDGRSATVYNNTLVIGGLFSSVSGVTAYAIARWNGAAWQALGNPAGLQDRHVTALTVYNGELIAGGNMFFNPPLFTGVIRWDDCAPPPCPADVTGDGAVNVNDLLAVINSWGNCPACPADVNGDNQVNVNDLLAVINAWGPCP